MPSSPPCQASLATPSRPRAAPRRPARAGPVPPTLTALCVPVPQSALRKLGYAEERTTRERPARLLWHLMPVGRELLVALGE